MLHVVIKKMKYDESYNFEREVINFLDISHSDSISIPSQDGWVYRYVKSLYTTCIKLFTFVVFRFCDLFRVKTKSCSWNTEKK